MNRTILFAALLISGAILINGHFDRASRASQFARPSTSAVREGMVDSFNYAFHKEREKFIMSKNGDVREIRVGDIRYSEGDRKMSVEFSFLGADGRQVSSGAVLTRDEFGVYRGTWESGGKKTVIKIDVPS